MASVILIDEVGSHFFFSQYIFAFWPRWARQNEAGGEQSACTVEQEEEELSKEAKSAKAFINIRWYK